MGCNVLSRDEIFPNRVPHCHFGFWVVSVMQNGTVQMFVIAKHFTYLKTPRYILAEFDSGKNVSEKTWILVIIIYINQQTVPTIDTLCGCVCCCWIFHTFKSCVFIGWSCLITIHVYNTFKSCVLLVDFV